MQFKSQNPNHYFFTSSLLEPELTLHEKFYAKGILSEYPRFKSLELSDITPDLLGRVTQRENPYMINPVHQVWIEDFILGYFYKFYRRCLTSHFDEKMTLDCLMTYCMNNDVEWVEKLDISSFCDGTQSLVEKKKYGPFA
jgi:hypothetical protein